MMGFEDILGLLKAGRRARRKAWPGGQFIYMVAGSKFEVNRPPLLGIYPEGTPIEYLPHIDVQLSIGTCGVWNAPQIDILANDWLVLPEPEGQGDV